MPIRFFLFTFVHMLDNLLFAKTPKLLTSLYPECTWSVETQENVLYLTFDDGPQPEITPFVLDELKKWNAKATFFCIGKNIDANPELFRRIEQEGHTVGNHTFDHLNGWNADNDKYFDNIEQCNTALIQNSKLKTHSLFRPPYGKLSRTQYNYLKSYYKIVMWDVLAFDYDLKVSGPKVVENILENSEAGSIIVMHDSLKAKPKVEYALPKILEHYTAKGFKFEKL